MYAKWAEEDSSLAGITNAKMVYPKNKDFQLKLDAWRSRVQDRKVAKERNEKNERPLREFFSKVADDFRIDKQQAIDCVNKF